ncbi:fungal-specific transcription factor domain-containing protein [Mycena galericulata]|nr:fungal-specific transcription factor domain-containing protein [Mycena galericulata]
MSSDDEEHSTPPDSGSQSSYKQRRPQRSCDICRHRKIRCDGQIKAPGGACSNCLAFGCPCTYLEPSKKRGPKNKQVEELKHRIATLEAKLRSQSFCSLCTQPLESRPDQPNSSASIFQQDTPERDTADHPPPEEDITQDELADRFRQISIGGLSDKFFGSASSFALVSSALAVKEKYLGQPSISQSRRAAYFDILPWEHELYRRRPHYGFPSSDLIASLVELYFTNVHPTLPILHRPSFERSVAEGLYLTDSKFGAVLLAVLGVASRYSDDPRILIDGNTLSSGWKFVAQVEILHKNFDPSVYEVQFYCLMTVFALGTSSPQISWVYVGIGVRYLQARGEHRRKREGHNFEAELWNRAFWSLFVIDRMVCTFLGRAPAIVDFDVDPPLEVDDEYWELGFTQPLGKPSRLSYFVYFVRLCEILGDALCRLYASKKWKTRMGWFGPEWEQSTVAELDSAMNDVFSSIPPHLRWDPHGEGVFFDQSGILHVTYYYIQFTIHRPYIHKPTALAGPSVSICTGAARSALHVAGLWANKMQRLPFTFLQNTSFAAALILLLNIFEGKRAGRAGLSIDDNKDLAQVGTAMDILKGAELRCQPAGRLWEMLQELQSLKPPPRSEFPEERTIVHCGYPPSDFIPSAANSDPPPNFAGGVEGFYTATEQSLQPGISFEQLLAHAPVRDRNPSVAPNGWSNSSGLQNDVLDDELMSMWLAAPADFMDINHWDAYIDSMNVVDVHWPNAQ